MLDTVAKRYACALFEIALEGNKVEVIDAEAEVLEEVFADSQVMAFLNSPRIPDATKKGVIDKLLADKFDKTLINLLKLLVDKKRTSSLPAILRYFDILTDQHRGVEVVTIVSAVELDAGQQAQIVEQLKRFSEYGNLEVKTEVNKGVLGGVKVRLGDNLVIDGTLSSKLKQMKEKLYQFHHSGTGA